MEREKADVGSLEGCPFFLGWAILSAFLPLPERVEPAVWRLWAEITPLFGIAVFTLAFWLVEKRKLRLCLWNHPSRGISVGIAAGIVWLGLDVGMLLLCGVIHFEGKNPVPHLPIWMLAAFLNVITQELLIRGYLYQMLKHTYSLSAAAIATSVLFTLLHGGAFEAGLVPVLNVLSTSLLLSVILEYTGSLIAPVMMHFLWNGIGAMILGVISLADDYPHLLSFRFTGGKLLTGGECGLEGSVVVLVFNLIWILFFAFLGKKRTDKRRAC